MVTTILTCVSMLPLPFCPSGVGWCPSGVGQVKPFFCDLRPPEGEHLIMGMDGMGMIQNGNGWNGNDNLGMLQNGSGWNGNVTEWE